MMEKDPKQDMSYEGAIVEELKVSSPITERIFSRKEIEELIPIKEGDKLVLLTVRLSQDGEVLTMEWLFESESELMKELKAGGEGLRYKYQISGDFDPVFSGQMTVLVKEYFYLKDNETSFGDTLAQYNKETEAWEYQ